jgi:hypothetical protein
MGIRYSNKDMAFEVQDKPPSKAKRGVRKARRPLPRITEIITDTLRPLYLQTAHGFVGSVTQERKCPCGVSHFLNTRTCYECSKVVK